GPQLRARARTWRMCRQNGKRAGGRKTEMDSFSVLDGGGEERRRGRASFLQVPLSGAKCPEPRARESARTLAWSCQSNPPATLLWHRH
ncbi:hypothetical protein HGM15179_004054, partial [Zosterops borbonicus]